MRRLSPSLNERRDADLFFADLMRGSPSGRRIARRQYDPFIEIDDETGPEQPQPYAPAGGRNFTPQQGTFNCTRGAFTVIAASLLPGRTTDPDAVIDAALTTVGLSGPDRGRIARAGLRPIASEFGGALTELVARLRWSATDIVRWGTKPDSMLVPRLLLHVPGHFRELARRAPDAREAFVLESIGWLLMSRLRTAVANTTRRTWWLPPAPSFVTAVPDPAPPLSTDVTQLLLRSALIDTTLTADQWNARLVEWGSSLAGRQWQAEVAAPQSGRPFYATLVAVPPHIDTAAIRANFKTGWDQRRSDTDARHTPHAAGATTVTLDGLRNAVALRECENDSPQLPSGAIRRLSLQGLELTYDFPRTSGRTITELPVMALLHPVYTALFRAIRALGWNDLLYQTSGAACFRGIKHPASARILIDGKRLTIDPFNNPTATTVTQVNTIFSATERARVIAATHTARNMSEHGLGAAVDFNVPENEQNVAARRFGSMDPRIVAIFEAFHFRCGARFEPPDPMHFDYCQAPCAPAAADAGSLGPVVTPGMLIPIAAASRVRA